MVFFLGLFLQFMEYYVMFFSFGCKLGLFLVLTAPQERACGLFCWAQPSFCHLVGSAEVRFSVGFVTPGRNEGPRLTGVARVWRELKRRHPLQLGQSFAGRGRQLKFQ